MSFDVSGGPRLAHQFDLLRIVFSWFLTFLLNPFFSQKSVPRVPQVAKNNHPTNTNNYYSLITNHSSSAEKKLIGWETITLFVFCSRDARFVEHGPCAKVARWRGGAWWLGFRRICNCCPTNHTNTFPDQRQNIATTISNPCRGAGAKMQIQILHGASQCMRQVDSS